MGRIVRYLTSFVGFVFHAISGLAALFVLPAILLVGVFLFPSMGIPLGIEVLGVTFAELIAVLEHETPLSTDVLVVTLVTLLVVFLGFKWVGNVLYRVGHD